MTAEIAILNKSAVALATDSAVTIGDGSETKIYNTVNKIFQLSHTVGIMIYGSLDFMGLPLETLIKEYRKTLDTKDFGAITQYVVDFKSFLESVSHSDKDEEINVHKVLRRSLSRLDSDIDRAFLDYIMEEGKYKRSKFNGVAERQIRRAIAAQKTFKLPVDFYPKRPTVLLEKYKPYFDNAIEWAFSRFVLSAANKVLLVKLCEEIILRSPLSSVRSGIVIAGFGTEEICPTVHSIEVDGIFGGKLKTMEHKKVDIGRDTVSADMLGFAQDDMVERFLNGVDPQYNRYVSTAVKKLMDDLVASLKKSSSEEAETAATQLDVVFKKIRDDLDIDLEKYRNKTFRTPTVDLVRFMPKQELAKLAESMIELTSLKRRVSWDQDTVGGDVDVAVVSKSDGFVWIKRKHYFPAELNPRFFHRLSTRDNGGAQ